MQSFISKYQVYSIVVALLFIGWPTKETKAQEGMLFADTTANWIIMHKEYEEFWDNGEFCKDNMFFRLYFFEGKKVLDGQEYSVLKSTCSYKVLGDCEGTIVSGVDRCDTSIHAYVREATELNKVFYHSSSPGPFDVSNRNLRERLHIDSDAFPFEELAMNFGVNNLEPGDSLHVSDRYPTKFFSKQPIAVSPGDSVSGIYFGEFIYPNYENWSIMIGYGGPLIEGVGYLGSVLYPVNDSFKREIEEDFYYNGLICYSKGGRFFYRAPEGKQHGDSGVCKLREPLSISDHKKPAVQPWVINPAKGKLEFLNPITGNLVVQDPRGRIIFQDEVQELRFLDAQEWSQGLYLLHWENDGGVKVAKVVLDSR